jgi:hypothetical protein
MLEPEKSEDWLPFVETKVVETFEVNQDGLSVPESEDGKGNEDSNDQS